MQETIPTIPAYQRLAKKQTRKEIFLKLSAAMAEYKSRLDKKKFETSLKKASKLFAAQLAKASKNTPPAKPAALKNKK